MKYIQKKVRSTIYKSSIIMEEGDYKLDPNKVKGLHVDCIYIPDCDKKHYTEDNLLYKQLLANISIAGILFGKIIIY